MDPNAIEVHLERGVLTISGERSARAADAAEKTTQHISERFTGPFRRVVSLPDDIDPGSVEARYRDGVLQVSVQRRIAAQPRRIEVQ
jgi:HSP20 family protein